jgi:hypothetical protein
MAGTIVQGNIPTEGQVGPSAATAFGGERIIDMDEKIRILRPDETQFTTMTSRTPTRVATSEKVHWLEEEDFPRIVTSTAAQLATDTTITLTAGQGLIVMGNDMLRNMRSGEMVRVVSVATDVVTIARGVGSIAAAAVNANDVWLVTGDAQPQGSDFPTPRYLARVVGFNYTQITRTAWGFTRTDTQINKYGGKEPQKEAKRKAREHKKKWEMTGFFGARSFASAVPPENNPRGTAGGLVEFIQTNKLNSAGVLSPTFWDSFVTSCMSVGSMNKVVFAAPAVVQCMSSWNRSGMGSQWDPGGFGHSREVYGVVVDAYISGAYGYQIPVVVKKEWSEFPIANQGYGGYVFLVDMDYVERRPLADADTKLLTDRQPAGKDSYNAEYMTEATYEIAHERTHGLIYGVTAPP